MKEHLVEKSALEKQLAADSKQQIQNEQTLAKYLAYKDQLTAEALQAQQIAEKARNDLASVAAIQADIQQQQRLAQDLERLFGLQQEKAKLEIQNSPKQQAVNQAQLHYQNQLRVADTLEMNWHNAQAAILAQRLQQGEACPVCGSQEHPTPAKFVGEQVSKEQVQYARNQAQEALSLANQLNGDLEQHHLLVEQYQQQINQLVNELGDNAQLPLNELQLSIANLNNQLQQLQSINLEQLTDKVNKLNERCIDGENKITELRNQMAANDSTLIARQTQLAKLVAAVGEQFADLASLEQEITRITQQRDNLNNGVEAAQTSYQNAVIAKSQAENELKTHQQIAKDANATLLQTQVEWQNAMKASVFDDESQFLQSKMSEQEMQALQVELDTFKQKQTQFEQTLADLNQMLAGKVLPDLTALNENFNKVQLGYDQAREKLDNTRSLYERLAKVHKDIKGLHQKNAKLEEAYKVFGTLYDVASGKTGSRVSLHRFVLGVLLDDVLIQASQRLSLMSKGRYVLERKTEGFKGAAGRGLDLVVEDGYTGKTRALTLKCRLA